jgi:Holliday junction resolvasome RuvABC endonuclease subunit
MLLALDASTTKFGFAFGRPEDRAPRSGVWRLPGAADIVLDQTLGMAAEQVTQMCRLIKATHVAIEAPVMMASSGSNSHTLAALIQISGAVRSAAHRSACHIVLVARSSALKHFVGHGRPEDPKASVQARCRQLSWDFADDNAADACCVWSWGCKHFWGKPLDICVTPLFSKARAA